MGDFFILIAMMLDIVASVSYLYQGDVYRSIYWLGAAVATVATIFMQRG